MRDTPKLLAALLLTITLALVAAPAGPAVAATTAHHKRVTQSRHGRSRHAARVKRQTHRAAAPKRVREHAAPIGHEHATTRGGRRSQGEAEPAPESTPPSAATIASVLDTPCQNTEVVPAAQNVPLVRAAVLCLINRTRAEHGLAPLIANAQLEAAAEGHCAELIADDYFAHVSPTGETPVDRITQTGYIPEPSVGYVIGENLAWGTYQLATPQAIVAAWIASPGHLANILESRYRETGIGVTPSVPRSLGEGNPGATYAQEFGVLIH